jgi:hypothetical protein
MAVQVKKYYARWKPADHTGYITVFWDGGSAGFSEGSFQSPEEFRLVVDLLRNESPIWWDAPTGRLYAHWEPVGEGE